MDGYQKEGIVDLDKFVGAAGTRGLARTSNWICRVFPPAQLNEVANTVLETSGYRVGGNRFDINLPGVDINGVGKVISGALNIPLSVIDIGVNLGIPPTGFTLSNTGSMMDSINLFAESCVIPERDIANYEFSEYGEKRKFGFLHRHAPLTVQYYCSESMLEREFFEQWQNIIFNPYQKMHGYYRDYISEIEILKYDGGWQNKMAVYKFHEAYPTRVGATTLTSDTSIVKLEIIFNFRHFERTE